MFPGVGCSGNLLSPTPGAVPLWTRFTMAGSIP